MADFSLYFNSLLRHEGGYVNDILDRGGATNRGITLNTWRRYGVDNDNDGDIDENDLRKMSTSQSADICKKIYWDGMQGDAIQNQNVANIVFDHAVNAGISRSIMMVQEILNRNFSRGVVVDGLMGRQTLTALNSVDGNIFHDLFKSMRTDYYNFLAGKYNGVNKRFFIGALRISPNATQERFLKGWLNRVTAFPFLNKTTGTLAFLGIGLFFFLIIKYYKHKSK